MDKNIAQTVTKNKPKTKDLILFIVTCILLLLTIISLILEVGLLGGFNYYSNIDPYESQISGAAVLLVLGMAGTIIGALLLLVPILIFLCLGLWFSLKLANKKRNCPAWMQVSSRVFAWVYAIIIALFVVLGGLIFWTMLLFG